MKARTLLRVLSATRLGIGTWMIFRPHDLLHTLAGVSSQGWPTRMAGAREIGLGTGGLLALRASGPDQAGDGETGRWLAAGMIADGGDVLVLGTAMRSGTIHPLLGSVALCSATVSVLAAGWASLADAGRAR